MIRIPSHLDFLAKLVSYLGIDFDEGNCETNKCRIKELKDFNNLSDKYNDFYFPRILDVLSGGNEDNKKAISCFFSVIESSMRYLSDKNYYTVASKKQVMWGLFIFYYIPLFARMLSMYQNEFKVPKYLIDNDFMLPIFEPNRIVSPTDRLKRYLSKKANEYAKEGVKKYVKKYVKKDGEEKENIKEILNNYLVELRKNTTPSHKIKLIFFNEIEKSIQGNNSLSIQEIESVFNCAIFTSRVYQDLSNLFDYNHAMMLIDYFRNVFDTVNKLNILIDDNIKIDIENGIEFEHLINFYVGSLSLELNYLNNPLSNEVETLCYQYREDLFHVFNSYLCESKYSEMDTLENINITDFSKGILRYNPDHIIQYSDIEHKEVVFLLKQLENIFLKRENELHEELIISLFKKIKANKHFKNYEHEFLFYEGLNHLANNEFLEANNKLESVCKKCTKITAGETKFRSAELNIMLRLLTEDKIVYSHLNPEIKYIIDSQPEESILKALPLFDEVKINEDIYMEKVERIVKEFNIDKYREDYPENKIVFSDIKPEEKPFIHLQQQDLIYTIAIANHDDKKGQQEFDLEIKEYIKCNSFYHQNTEWNTGFSFINPQVTQIIDFQSKGFILIISPNFDYTKRNHEIYFEKVLKIIENFNTNGYCHYDGVECKKFNPLKKMDNWITDFFKLYDDSSENEEKKVEQAIKKLMTGRGAKYPIKNPIVTILKYTALEAFHKTMEIYTIYSELKVHSQNMDRLFDSKNIKILITRTLENLNG